MTEPKRISQDFIAPPPALASYDWQDLATGLNYNIYYAFEDGANVYGLTDQTIYSDVIGANRTGTGTSTLTFNSSVFNIPQTAKGTAIINIPLLTGVNVVGHATATIYHMDGATATSLGTATGIANPCTSNSTKIQCLQIALTEKHFKKGDHLRLVIEYVQSAGANILWFAYDPAGRAWATIEASTWESTTLSAHIPFKTTD